MHDTLVDASISLIRSNQNTSGAYIASPSFPTYAYCWLRHGAYIAHAMDVHGEHESAKAFFRWVNEIISNNRADTERASDAVEGAQPERQGLRTHSVEQVRRSLRARWTLDGRRDDSEWPNYQPDGMAPGCGRLMSILSALATLACGMNRVRPSGTSWSACRGCGRCPAATAGRSTPTRFTRLR